MVIAVVFVGLVVGIASGGTLRLAFDLGWISTICGFYGGAFAGIALAALRVATLRDDREDPDMTEPAPAPAQIVARAS